MPPSIYDFLPPGTREQAGYAGLGALAQALLAGGAPTTTPGAGIAALGQGFSGFGQAYNGRLNSGVQQAAMGMQLAKAQRDQEAEDRYRQMVTPQPIGPQYAMADGAGPGRVGPTPQAAQGMAQEGNPLLASLPPAARAILPGLPMSAGTQLIGQMLNREDDPSKRYKEVNGQLYDLRAPGGPSLVRGVAGKAPEGFRYRDDGSLELIPGYAQGKGTLSAQTEPLVPVLDPVSGTVTYTRRAQAEGKAAPDQATIVMGPDGKPIFMRGGSQAMQGMISGLGQQAQNKVQEALIDMTAQQAQVNRIVGQFKPEYQQIGTRAGLSWSRIKEKGGMTLDPGERQQVADFAKYKAEAGQFFADRLKAMSGAAVTEQEMKRQEAYLPTPGSGILDGDSPTEFAAKAKRMQEFMQQATARLHYVTKKGMSIKDVPLDDMPRIIRDRGNELAEQFGKQNIDGDALKQAVRQQLAREFGLVND